MAEIKDYATLSNEVYVGGGGNPGGAWQAIAVSLPNATGYYGVAYYNRDTKEIVIAHRGTQILSGQDLLASLQALTGQVPNQVNDALAFYQAALDRATDLGLTVATTSHTGHSLGGAIARRVSVELGQAATIFNAPGVSETLNLPANADVRQLTVINSAYDPVSAYGTQVGNVRNVFVSYLPLVPDLIEPLVLLLTFKAPALGWILNGDFYLSQHSMQKLLAVIGAGGYASFDPATLPLDVTADGTVIGAGIAEWQALEQAIQNNPELFPTGLLPEGDLSSGQILDEQDTSLSTPATFENTGAGTLIAGKNGIDDLEGGVGTDILFGDDGNDTLSGEQGNDLLVGGNGNDIYYYTAGDGADILIDNSAPGASGDGLGRIVYTDATGNRHLLTGGRQAGDGATVYRSPDGRVQYRRDPNGALIVTLDGVDALTLPNFQSGDLGIVLDDLTGIDLPSRGDLTAPTTQTIHGQDGDDNIDAANVSGIQLFGGNGNDILLGDYYYAGEYYDLGKTEFERIYGRVKPGIGTTLYGEAGNDHLFGSLKDDTLDGGLDHDRLEGYLGDDVLTGGLGNDLLNGHEGQDNLNGGDGNDRLGGGEGSDRLQGGLGDDRLYGDSDPSGIYVTWDGTNGTLLSGTLQTLTLPVIKDAPEAQAGDDVLEGGAGNDQLYGGAGDDLLDGGTENDELQGEGGDDILLGGDGDDLLFGDSDANALANDATVIGTYGTYTYYQRQRHTGPDGADYMDGGLGDDKLWGGGGNDHLLGGAGSDYLHGGLYNGSVSGDDVLEGGDGNDFLFGEDGNDTLRGDAGADQLTGGAGNDGLFGGAENDQLWGDAGNDVLHGEAGDDYLDGGDGDDTLFGGAGIDRFLGGAGRDVIYAGLGNDAIDAGDQDDLIFGEDGDDSILGGAGNDEIYGGAGTNALFGGDGNDTITGGDGNDTLNGGAGDDALTGGGGNDFLDGGAGTDTLAGGAGNDTYTVTNAGGIFIENANEGIDTVQSAITHTLAANVENLTLTGTGAIDATGNTLSNVLTGNAANNTLTGGAGDDTYLFGIGGAQDTVIDTSGNDAVIFGAGITAALLTASFVNGDLVITVSANDRLTVAGWQSGNRIELFTFADGSSLTAAQMEALATPPPVNTPPTVANAIADQSGGEGVAFSYTVPANAFADPDVGDNLTYVALLASGAALPAWLAFDPVTRRFSGTPANGDNGVYDIRVTATDSAGASVSDEFSLAVANTIADDITGTEAADVLTGTSGDDRIFGLGGNDTLNGLAGNDVLDGGLGTDTMAGGAGDDTYVVDNTGDVVTENASEGTDTVQSSVTHTLAANVENLSLTGTSAINGTGNALDNVLTGNSANNLLEGGAGNDTYVSSGGNDTLRDVTGNDTYRIGPNLTDGFLVTIDDRGGLDTLAFEPMPTGAGLSRPTLEGAYRDGNDLVLNVYLKPDALAPDIRGQVRITNHFAGNALESIQGLLFTNTTGTGAKVLLTEEVASQIHGSYLNTFDSGADFIPYIYGKGYSGIYKYLAVGGGGNDLLSQDIAKLLPGTYRGGGGDDRMVGGRAGDIYYFNPLEADEVYDQGLGASPFARDTLVLDTNTALADLVFTRQGNDLFIGNTRISRYFERDVTTIDLALQYPYMIETLQGQGWEINLPIYLVDLGLYPGATGTEGNDTLVGDIYDNAIDGLGGNDNINGKDGNDRLAGGDGDDFLQGDNGDDRLKGGAGDDFLAGWNGDDVLEGGAGRDDLYGDQGDDTLLGGDGNDYLSGDDGPTGGADILDGGAGDDIMRGGAGNDIYRIYRGDGFDTVNESGNYGTADTVVFGAGIVIEDIKVEWNAGVSYVDEFGDPIVSPGMLWVDLGNGDGLMLQDGSGGQDFGVESFTFADGRTLTLAQLKALDTNTARIGVQVGTAGNDVLSGSGWTDSLYAYGGDDVLIGGLRSDSLFGDAGADILVGGQGGDDLRGGAGSDVYLFNPGDVNAAAYSSPSYPWFTQDSISEVADQTAGSDVDTLSIGGGIGPQQLFAYLETVTNADGTGYTSLVLRVGTTDDVIYIPWSGSYFDANGVLVNETYHVERLQFLGGASDKVFDLVGVVNANMAALTAAYTGNPVNPAFVALFTTAALTAYDITATAGFAGGTHALQYATTGTVPVTPVTPPENVINGTAGSDVLNGTAGKDRINGLAGNDTLNGLAGNDVLDGGTGTDTMKGGSGDDTYIVDNTGDIVTENANEGTDTAESSVTYTLSANVENLTLTGTSAINGTGNSLANVITGNSANNTLDGGSGADTLIGGAGDDTYTVDNVGDIVTENANEGLDKVNSSVSYALAANVENLTLTGTGAINGTGNDMDNVLTGNSGNNTLTGGAGNDTLNGGTGSDTLRGGTGDDSYVVNSTGDVVTENASEGMDTVQSSITYTLGNNLENLTLTGTTAINGTGNALDNRLIGNSANNILTGNAGNDFLDGGTGSDTLRGGVGNDTYVVNSTGDVVTENSNEGTDTVQSSITYTLGNNVENLTLTGTGAINGTGNSLNNTLTGNGANNTLTANAGNDVLDGQGGNDTLNGGAGNDTYVFNRGYGQDSVTDNDATVGNTDTALIGVNPLDIVFTRSGNNLVMSLHGGTDKLTINSWYTSTSYQTEVIRAADGRMLLSGQVDQLIQAMATFSATHGGMTWDQAIDQNPNEVQAVLAAVWATN